MLRATTACTFSTSQLPKVVLTWCVLYILTSKCASRHNGMQFFISHLASWLRTRRFSEPAFRLSGATKPLEKHSVSRLSYLFAHLDLSSADFLFFDSRHNGVHFFPHRNFQKWSVHGVFCTFCLRNVLCVTTACNFSSLIWPAGSAPAALASLLFDPPEPQTIGKTLCFATFLPFRAPASSFSSDSFSSLIFSLLLSLLFICPYCRKFDF